MFMSIIYYYALVCIQSTTVMQTLDESNANCLIRSCGINSEAGHLKAFEQSGIHSTDCP